MGGHGTGGILPSKSSQSGRTTGRAGVMSALGLVVYLVVTHSQLR